MTTFIAHCSRCHRDIGETENFSSAKFALAAHYNTAHHTEQVGDVSERLPNGITTRPITARLEFGSDWGAMGPSSIGVRLDGQPPAA